MISQQQKDEMLWQMAKARVAFRWSACCYLLVNAMLVAIWFFTAPDIRSYFWPIWPMMGWGVGLAFHYFRAYHGNGLSMTETEYEKLRQQNNQ